MGINIRNRCFFKYFITFKLLGWRMTKAVANR